MSDYEQKPGQGAIFKNEKREKESHPHYRGNFITPSGEKLEIALWLKEAKSGKKYFSVAVSEPYQKPDAQQQQSTPNPTTSPAVEDDLPF
ncbi:MAG: hypothetical protein RRY23_06105 [Alistipes sp.]